MIKRCRSLTGKEVEKREKETTFEEDPCVEMVGGGGGLRGKTPQKKPPGR